MRESEQVYHCIDTDARTERLLQRLELLVTFIKSEGDWFEGLRGLGDSLTAKGEWPPKPIKACSLCKVVVPRERESPYPQVFPATALPRVNQADLEGLYPTPCTEDQAASNYCQP